MKAFYRVKRDGTGLWLKMYTDCPWPWFQESLQLHQDNDVKAQVKVAFQEFIESCKLAVRT